MNSAPVDFNTGGAIRNRHLKPGAFHDSRQERRLYGEMLHIPAFDIDLHDARGLYQAGQFARPLMQQNGGARIELNCLRTPRQANSPIWPGAH